ncbi:YaaR family protein [Herbivorax sp. ANBcel31]|uniref:YaaR family protein n=1 Tax=Herbivorax sp. ANBcel31 TaxID=3069754 RepID=UPI0027B1A647|nr:YaaR family protein [Herbivorax sp. ANBcel31]MDQ2086370.1 YaaR family protein [Herbivorax sp. ANBcel31]
MRIKEAMANTANVQGMGSKDDKKTIDGKETSFRNHLKSFDGGNFEERIKQLIGQIEKQGEKLGQKVDLRELKIYKKLISEFLDEAVSNSHKFSKDSSLDRRGRYKVFANVKKINKELDQLTNDILNGEEDNIKILKKIEDIRGLVLDLLI